MTKEQHRMNTPLESFKNARLLVIFMSAFFAFPACAQLENVRPYPMEEKALLWQIEGEGVQDKCYLFGTMHLIEKDYFYFPKKLEKALVKSECLTMEISDFPDQKQVFDMILLKEGSIFDFFSEAQTDSLFVWAKEKMGMSEEAFRKGFSKMKPIALVQLATQFALKGDVESYEIAFEKIARQNQLRVLGLESIDDQMKLFDSLPSTQQATMVMEAITNDPAADSVTHQILELYRAQDIDALYLLIASDDGVISDEQKVFLDDRNLKWIPLIETMIADKKTFIAVGAGHLGGPNGLIRLLEKEGYTLTPIEL